MKPVIPNRLRIEQALAKIDDLSVDERKILFDKLDVTFRSPVDRAMAEIEKMSDEEREELFDLTEDMFCQECGERMPEDEADHECPYDDEPEDGDEPLEGDNNDADYNEGDEPDEQHAETEPEGES